MISGICYHNRKVTITEWVTLLNTYAALPGMSPGSLLSIISVHLHTHSGR